MVPHYESATNEKFQEQKQPKGMQMAHFESPNSLVKKSMVVFYVGCRGLLLKELVPDRDRRRIKRRFAERIAGKRLAKHHFILPTVIDLFRGF